MAVVRSSHCCWGWGRVTMEEPSAWPAPSGDPFLSAEGMAVVQSLVESHWNPTLWNLLEIHPLRYKGDLLIGRYLVGGTLLQSLLQKGCQSKLLAAGSCRSWPLEKLWVLCELGPEDAVDSAGAGTRGVTWALGAFRESMSELGKKNSSSCNVSLAPSTGKA